MSQELEQILGGVSKVATELGGMFPDEWGIVARVIGIATKAAAALAAGGLDPEIEMSRVDDADPLVVEARDEIEQAIADRFHKKTDPPTAGDGSDVYNEDSDHEDGQA